MNAPLSIQQLLPELDHTHLDWLEEEAIFILRETVAAALVRLGMTLDRSAGERVLTPLRRDTRWEDGHGVYS